jgi:hypothetical protein
MCRMMNVAMLTLKAIQMAGRFGNAAICKPIR